MITKVRGTQDFIDLTLFNFIVERARTFLTDHHFTEIATPILEQTALFHRTLGTYTDVVTKEMYTINTGEGGESLCLRPEATAATVRAFAENGIDQLPWKVFSWGPMFRHERPQKGRYRQFHQVNIELIGAQPIAHDAHFIASLAYFFNEFLRIRDYTLLLNFVGCADDRNQFTSTLRTFLHQHMQTLCKTCVERADKNPLRIFDCKVETCRELYKTAPHITDSLCESCTQEWQQLQQFLTALGVTFVKAPTLVRGFDYYNKTVFEFVSSHLGAQSAFCAGGRYDSLVRDISGSADQPAIGAGMGIERLMIILESQKDQLPLPVLKPLYVIIPCEDRFQEYALRVAQILERAGVRIDILLNHASLKSMLRHANRIGAIVCIIIGEQEVVGNTVMVKNMVAGTQEQIELANLVDYVR